MKFEFDPSGSRVAVWTPAKVNLFFEILGKRADGYHEIETVVAPIDLYDRLEFIRTDVPGLTVEAFDGEGRPDPDVPCDESNLIAKAYRVFIDEYPDFAEKSGYTCKVVKKIPTKAGLGGGSSDAAAALAVFSRLRAVPLSKERLQELAGRVGSDGPLFFEDGASVGRGRGELVEPIECPSLWLTVVKPVDGLSTAAVYGRYASASSHGPQKSLDEFCAGVRRAAELARSALALSEEERSARLDSVRLEIAQTVARKIANRLEEPADAMWSGFERRRELLRSTGALGVQISGSGSALFAIYPDERSAKRAAEEARRAIEDPASDLRGDRVYAVRTLSSLVL